MIEMWSRTVGVLILLLSASLSGCLSDSKNDSNIEIIVDYQENNGTVVESYTDGELISISEVSFDFDFSQTIASNPLVTYGIDTMDGRSPVTVNASSNSVITVEFSKHGMYNINAFAIDNKNHQDNISILIRVELRIEWVEFESNNPKTMIFDPRPENGGQNPTQIEVNSLVENPSLIDEFGGGQSVQFTWNIVDEQDDVCQGKSDEVDDGESATWYTVHFNTFQVHELRISYDDGQDYININQSVSIQYNEG